MWYWGRMEGRRGGSATPDDRSVYLMRTEACSKHSIQDWVHSYMLARLLASETCGLHEPLEWMLIPK